MLLTMIRQATVKSNLQLQPKLLSFAVYRSLEQVLGVLTSSENLSFPEVKLLLDVASEKQLIQKSANGSYELTPLTAASAMKRTEESPFIVIEGLDGSGKTTLTELLSVKFNLCKLETPPSYIRTVNNVNIRDFFDVKSETVKRAYYGLGNYLAAKDALESDRAVIMDRFWHSTTAYAFANFLKLGAGESCYADEDLSWPKDLIKPNLVIFLTLSEKERQRRHTSRKNFTNTAEEQTLAVDPQFRENLKNCFKRISGAPFEEFDCDGHRNETCANLLKFVSKKFPALKVLEDQDAEK